MEVARRRRVGGLALLPSRGAARWAVRRHVTVIVDGEKRRVAKRFHHGSAPPGLSRPDPAWASPSGEARHPGNAVADGDVTVKDLLQNLGVGDRALTIRDGALEEPLSVDLVRVRYALPSATLPSAGRPGLDDRHLDERALADPGFQVPGVPQALEDAGEDRPPRRGLQDRGGPRGQVGPG